MGTSPTGPSTPPFGVTVDGRREILGLWAGTGGEGAKFWLQVLTEVKDRDTDDVCMLVCDGLKADSRCWRGPHARS